MASIIKNQILKHLTKFAKNLTADKISVDVLKGKGQLELVELNEEVLAGVLELPAFIHIKKATAVRIGVKVPWTQLKTQPIQLFIDEIIMEVEMSSELRKPRPPNMAQNALAAYAENSYGFANKVAEGMSFYINTLEISFTSETFCGSFMVGSKLSRLCVESVSPRWQKADNLRQTRISDHSLHQCLIFKQLLRMEASASSARVDGKGPPISAPLRLITSQGKSRIVVKKSTVDGSVVAGRIQVILDQILWVATLPQIKSAIAFYDHLTGLMKKAADANKFAQAQKIIQQQAATKPRSGSSPSLKTAAPHPKVEASKVFTTFDIPQTSYHFYLAQIDLHLCDDANAGVAVPEDWDIENGALQISLIRLAADIYPYHLAAGNRNSWVRYKNTECLDWVRRLLTHYHNLLAVKLSIRDRAVLESEWARLMSATVVLRIDDLTINSVSEASTRREEMGRFLAGDKAGTPMPEATPLLHAEFTDHYHPVAHPTLPTPPAVSQILLSPIRLELDLRTIRWLHYVATDVFQTLNLDDQSLGPNGPPHSDIRLEAVMPKLVIPVPRGESLRMPKKPSSISLQSSRLRLSNSLVPSPGSGAAFPPPDALRCLFSRLSSTELFAGDAPLCELGLGALPPLPGACPAWRRYLTQLCELHTPDPKATPPSPSSSEEDLLDLELGGPAREDFWCLGLEPAWAEFGGNAVYYPRPMPLLFDAPLTVWALLGAEGPDAPALFVLFEAEKRLRLCLNHFQYLAFLHTLDALGLFSEKLKADRAFFTDKEVPEELMSVVGLLGDVDLSLVLPTEPPLSPYATDTRLRSNSPDLDGSSEASAEVTPRAAPTPPPRPAVVQEEFPVFLAFGDASSDTASVAGGGRADDVMSVATDASDDEQFVILETSSSVDDIFGNKAGAGEANLGEVSLVTVELRETSVLLGGRGSRTGIRVEAARLALREDLGLQLRTAHARLQSPQQAPVENSTGLLAPRAARKRPELSLAIVSKGGGQKTDVMGQVDGLSVRLHNTSMANLAGFLEDEGDAASNLRIRLADIHAKLYEDGKADEVRVATREAWVLIGEPPELPPCLLGPQRAEEPRVAALEAEKAELQRQLNTALGLVKKLTIHNHNAQQPK